MKTNKLQFASRLAFLALATVVTSSFVACGGDDDEPSTDSRLSDKTTPVTFRLDDGRSYMFDYSGSQYVGSDTLEVYGSTYHADEKTYYKEVKIDLRQGQHQLMWFRGINNSSVRFDPLAKCVTISGSNNPDKVKFAMCDANVSEYLLPPFNLSFQDLTARLEILMSADAIYEAVGNIRNVAAAKIIGLPVVASVSVLGEGYKVDFLSTTIGFGAAGISNFAFYGSPYILCPKEGLNDIQLTVEFTDKNGTQIGTVNLPKVSLLRGQVTIIGKISLSEDENDWVTGMVTYEEYDETMK